MSRRCLFKTAILLLVLLLPSSGFAIRPSSFCFQDVLNTVIGENRFITNRNIREYGIDLGEDFRRDYATFGPNDLVIDLGSGDFVASRQAAGQQLFMLEEHNHPGEFFVQSIFDRTPESFPQVTAIAYQGPTIPSGKNFTALQGRYFEDIPNEEIIHGVKGRRKFIDDFGVTAYTYRPSEALNKIITMMDAGNQFHLNVGSVPSPQEIESILALAKKGKLTAYPFPSKNPIKRALKYFFRDYDSTLYTTVIKDGDRYFTLPDWLKQLPQFEPKQTSHSLTLTATQIKDPVPPLKLIQAKKTRMPPYPRLFEVVR